MAEKHRAIGGTEQVREEAGEKEDRRVEQREHAHAARRALNEIGGEALRTVGRLRPAVLFGMKESRTAGRPGQVRPAPSSTARAVASRPSRPAARCTPWSRAGTSRGPRRTLQFPPAGSL